MSLRDDLLAMLWDGVDPLADVSEADAPFDLQGWSSQHPLLEEAIDAGPRVIVEVGVWKGASVVFMARRLRERKLESVIIAVDTWLGSWEHWERREWRADLGFNHGFPTLFRTFQNVIRCGVANYVIPLPLDSLNAATVLRNHAIRPDLIHVDAGHDYRSVMNDLEVWWERLVSGGSLVVDDYDPGGETWPSVRDAVDDFVASASPESFDVRPLKALLTKR
jgi:hypothetical protein